MTGVVTPLPVANSQSLVGGVLVNSGVSDYKSDDSGKEKFALTKASKIDANGNAISEQGIASRQRPISPFALKADKSWRSSCPPLAVGYGRSFDLPVSR